MKDLWTYLKEYHRDIVLYGMGDGAEKVINALEMYGLRPSGVFASDGFVRPKTFKGMPVTDYATAKAAFPDMVVLLCFGTSLPDVIANIKRISYESELYAPDVPVYGGPVFDGKFYTDNIEAIKTVRSLLADDTSRTCFDSIIEYKLTGDINHLFWCETSPDEPYINIIDPTRCETFFDLGAYRGDTVNEFLRHEPSCRNIVAVEPDKKTFSKLCRELSAIGGIKFVNAAVSDTCGEIPFTMSASRGSNIGGELFIPSVTVDSLSVTVPPSFIKFDIEGAELSALEGAAETIKKYRPQMQIAAYHRSEDIFKVPLSVIQKNSGYKVYLRHFPGLPAWDTNYYFV